MHSIKYLALLGLATLAFAIPVTKSDAQVGIGIGVGGPAYYGGGYDYPAPVCDYGYYSYYPYSCAPYGYYGPSWFSGGLFIGLAHGFVAAMAIADTGSEAVTATAAAMAIAADTAAEATATMATTAADTAAVADSWAVEREAALVADRASIPARAVEGSAGHPVVDFTAAAVGFAAVAADHTAVVTADPTYY